MTEEYIEQLKSALKKCEKENENRPTFTCEVIVSSVCKSARECIAELEKKIKEYKKQINLKEKALARIKRENESLIDQNAMYEFFYEGNGFYKRGLNNSIMIEEYIEKLEKDNRLLEQRGSDILKELLDNNKKYIELEQQIEKMKCCQNCKHCAKIHDYDLDNEEDDNIEFCEVRCHERSRWELKEIEK